MAEIKVYGFADEASPSVDGQIAAMVRNGLSGVEIRGVDSVNVSEISVEKAKEVKKKLDDAGLDVWSVGSPIGKIEVTAPLAPHLELFRHTLEVANVLGAKNLRVFSFYIPNGHEAGEYKEPVLERMGSLLALAQGSGVRLCHENEKGIYGQTPQRCLEMFQALPGLKGIFDPANFVQCAVEPLEAWELLKEHIAYLHIKDSKTNGLVVPAGQGDGQIAQIVRGYVQQGGGQVVMEPHLTAFEGLQALEREGEESVIGTQTYESNDAAFDAACQAFYRILEKEKLSYGKR